MLLPSHLHRLQLGLTVAVVAGCGGGDLTVLPSTGTLEITTATSGADQDADGYSVQMDAGTFRAIGAAATLTTSDVTPGNHTVWLREVAANCTVAGDNPRTTIVTAGATATVSFAVTCSATSPTTGIIRVSVTTSGSPTDPDGYITKLDAADPGLTIGTNGTVSFTAIPVGTHAIALTGMAANCSVTDGTSRSATVTAGATAEVSFVVTCVAPNTFPILFNAGAVDPAIFLMNSDGTGLKKLTDGRGPHWSPDHRKILFLSIEGLSVINADASGEAVLYKGPPWIEDYQWSPDGRRIAYITRTCLDPRCEGPVVDSLRVMEADGSGKTPLTDNAGWLSWSPDGRKIVFVGSDGIDIIDSDGRNKTLLTTQSYPREIAWSPDGARIAFVSANVRLPNGDFAESDIFLISPDGSGLVNLTQDRELDVGPEWSPDGGKLVFVTYKQPNRIAVVNRDGSGRTDLTHEAVANDYAPCWSPDGRQIVFERYPPQSMNSDLYVMQADGSNPRNITNTPGGGDYSVDW
jgi:Tol biopolymer transport system component